jgi:cytochrome c
VIAGKISFILVGVGVAAAVGLSFVHPWGDVRDVGADGGMFAASDAPQDVKQVLESKCVDCHSNRTHWPVYSRMAPGSWLMEHDVSKGRAALNFSRWRRMGSEERIDALSRIAAEVRSAEMPPKPYILMHSSRRVSELEKQRIATWARAERKRLRSAAEPEKETGGQ